MPESNAACSPIVPDMMFVTYLTSRYMAKPMDIHLQATKIALRYQKGIVNYGIYYRLRGNGVLFLLSSGVVSWCSKKQLIVTLSTTKAEFVSTTLYAC